MAEHMFLRTTISVVWDFDSTLVPGACKNPCSAVSARDLGNYNRRTQLVDQHYGFDLGT
jgi:hypothetical protein